MFLGLGQGAGYNKQRGLQAEASALAKALGGGLFLPDTSNCWQDTGKTTPCAYDTKVAHMDDVTGLFTATQPTTNFQPYLRRDNFSVLPFTSATGEVWTVNRTQIQDAGGIEWANGEAYWRNPAGTAGNYVSTPDSAAASITGDGTWIFDGALVDWSPAAINGAASKISGTTGEYGITVLTDGTVKLSWYVAGVLKSATSTAAIGATDGGNCAIKVVRTIGVKVQFYKATDFNRTTRTGTWIQIGSDVANTDAAATDTANALLIGVAASAATSPGGGKIHYAAAWANTTGEGMPAWEFHPTRDAVKPASPWLDADGIDDYMITSIQPGLYGSGYVCAGAVQTEAIGAVANTILGSSSSVAVRGPRYNIGSTGGVEIHILDGTDDSSKTTASLSGFIAANVPFITAASYSTNVQTVSLNGGFKVSAAHSQDYTDTSQYATIFAANNSASGITPISYLKGHIHGFAWTQTIPTDAQDAAIQRYLAQRTYMVATQLPTYYGLLDELGNYLVTESNEYLEI